MGEAANLMKLLEQKEKVRKAQQLYEPWMDNKAGSSASAKDYIPSPVHTVVPKQRSKFNFDEDYLKAVSLSPSVSSRMSERSMSLHLPPSDSPVNATPLPTKDRPDSSSLVNQKARRGDSSGSRSRRSPAAKGNLSDELGSAAIYSEFYAWVFNGKQADITSEVVVQLLFRSGNQQR